jgi:hypothetical protein
MCLRVAHVECIDDHADVGAVLAAHLGLRDVDHLEALAVEFLHELAVAAPVAVGPLRDDAALLEDALEHDLDFETSGLGVLDTQREILEIHVNRYA